MGYKKSYGLAITALDLQVELCGVAEVLDGLDTAMMGSVVFM